MALICDRTVEIDTKAAFAMSSAQWPSMSSDSTTCSRSVNRANNSRREPRRRASGGSAVDATGAARDAAGRADTRQPGDGLEQLVERFVLADDGRRSGSKPGRGSVTVPGVIDDAHLASGSVARFRTMVDPDWTLKGRRSISTRSGLHSSFRSISWALAAVCSGGESVRSQRASQSAGEKIAPGDQHASGLYRRVRRTVARHGSCDDLRRTAGPCGRTGRYPLVPDSPFRAVTDIVIACQTRSALAQCLRDRANSVRASSQCPTPIL